MNDLLAALNRLGFTQYEARAYTALLKSPRITGYELSKRSGIPQSKIYEVLEKLAQKQLIVSVEDGGFAQYFPLDPSEAMNSYRLAYMSALDLVDEELRHLYTSDHEDAAYVLNLAGPESIIARANQMIGKAAEHIHSMIWPNEVSGVRAALSEAEARGVAIALCVYGEEDLDIGAVYHHQVDDFVSRSQRARRLVLAVDNREVLVAHFNDSKEATGHWSTNDGFVEMGVDYIRHDIFMLKMAEDFGDLMAEKYGPSRELLRDSDIFSRSSRLVSGAEG